ncbi:hypothetical protein A9Q81_25220 [Gammaproteobacteria bacterium 42_54_T18]|nr:hypothetical protein A9Q81_25220 [Gammaproteobacteria bacterium 42_54_T18]
MLQGYVHPDFGKVADLLRNQIPRNKPGGAALTVYHRGQCVVDIWGGTRNKDGDAWQSDTLAMSFSTTKGVASTLLHILVDQGLLDYNDPVSKHWPEFAQKGKKDITVRQLLCHEAGLFHIRDMIEDAEQMLDWDFMIGAIERSRPVHTPGQHNGYHALTYGWLIGELIHRVTNKPFEQVLSEKLSKPLGLDGLFVGMPPEQNKRRAHLINSIGGERTGKQVERILQRNALKAITQGLKLANIDLDQTISALIPRGMLYLDLNHSDIANACIPAMNGMFTSRSLAKVYAMLANGGEIDGTRILSRAAVQNMMQIQNRDPGKVIPLPMHWRLGYHRVFALGSSTQQCFGHFGFGGSGAWADPIRDISIGLTLNSGVGSPFGDTRIVNISSAILKCADQRYRVADAEEIKGVGPFFPKEKLSGYHAAKKMVNGVLPRRRRNDFALQ